jgi:hypothetical protein
LSQKQALFGRKQGQNPGFAVTNKLTGKNRKLFINCELIAFNYLQNVNKVAGGRGVFQWSVVSGQKSSAALAVVHRFILRSIWEIIC